MNQRRTEKGSATPPQPPHILRRRDPFVFDERRRGRAADGHERNSARFLVVEAPTKQGRRARGTHCALTSVAVGWRRDGGILLRDRETMVFSAINAAIVVMVASAISSVYLGDARDNRGRKIIESNLMSTPYSFSRASSNDHVVRSTFTPSDYFNFVRSGMESKRLLEWRVESDQTCT